VKYTGDNIDTLSRCRACGIIHKKVGHASISDFRFQISNLKHSRRRILPMRNAEYGVRNLTNYRVVGKNVRGRGLNFYSQ
jgi:uncharacterized Zn finger protein